VLLAEALQEQSRWDESLSYLHQVLASSQGSPGEMAFILSAKARRRLGYLNFPDLAKLPLQLREFMSRARDVGSQLRAAVEIASIFDTTRSTDIAPKVLQMVDKVGERHLSLEDRAYLLLAKSMLLYNLNDLAYSLRCVNEGIAMLHSRNYPNSILAMLQNGAGAIHSKKGSYAASIEPLLQSCQTAVRIGNDSTYIQASANLSLSYMRLGEYEKTLECAERVFASSFNAFSSHYFLPAARSAVIAHAMLRNTAMTEAVVGWGNEQFAHCPYPTVSQAWALYTADAYAVLGRAHEAEEQGRVGTEGNNAELRADYYVGPYARWVARTRAHSGGFKNSEDVLNLLLSNLDRYDTLDQAEILNAKAWLNRKTGRTPLDSSEQMHARLTLLPEAITDQLGRMGMLSNT
jgi:tetratricopeptide (TPR) repeat protein